MERSGMQELLAVVVIGLMAWGTESVDAARTPPPLHQAARKGDVEQVRSLIASGADVNGRDCDGRTPLHAVVLTRNQEIANLLIAGGADVNAKDQWGRTALHEAASYGREEMASFLLAHGANVNAETTHRATPLHETVRYGWGSWRDSNERSRDQEAMVKLLITHGANVNAEDSEGATPLYLAAGNGEKTVVSLLLKSGADVNNLMVRERSTTPLHAALSDRYMNPEDCNSVVRLLMDRGADVNAKNGDGDRPLSMAAGHGWRNVVSLLIGKGADVNGKRQMDRTPLHDAAAGGYMDVVEVLLAHGAYVNARTTLGATPLHLAAQEGHVGVAEMLIANGADVNARSLSDGTPLHDAAKRGHYAVVELLMEHGVDAGAKTATGRTAVDFARQAGREDITRLLIRGPSAAANTTADAGDANSPVQPRTDEEALVLGNTAFAIDLYGQLRTSPGNLFFSPHSISTALAMASAGAAGDTEKQIRSVLHFTPDKTKLHPAFGELQGRLNGMQDAGYIELHTANSLWPQRTYTFLDEYLSLLKTDYGVSVTPVDYVEAPDAACRTINQWVEQKTQGRIKDLIERGSIDKLTRLVLVNAIYFKGAWLKPFDAHNTSDASFYVSVRKSVRASMMTQKEAVRYAEFNTFAVVELPYRGEGLSMLILLPKRIDGVEQLERGLSGASLAQWRARLEQQEVDIVLPKFKMSTMLTLVDTLKAMGVTDAFNNPQVPSQTGGKADFSGMDGGHDLYINAVIHKAFVEVNEKGTEAAAATGLGMGAGASPPPPIFRADHPFLFLIQENRTGSILFIGRVTDPTNTPGD